MMPSKPGALAGCHPGVNQHGQKWSAKPPGSQGRFSRLEMLDEIRADFFAQRQRFVQRLVLHRDSQCNGPRSSESFFNSA